MLKNKIKKLIKNYLMKSVSEPSTDFQNSGTMFYRNKPMLELFFHIIKSCYREKKVVAWNIGSSIGAETYSFGCFLELARRQSLIKDYKLIASDNIFENLKKIKENTYDKSLYNQASHESWSVYPLIMDFVKHNEHGSVSFAKDICDRIELRCFNFNEPEPLFNEGFRGEVHEKVDLLIFNFSFCYAVPNMTHLQAVLRNIFAKAHEDAFLFSNTMTVDWHYDLSGADIYRDAAAVIMAEYKFYPVKELQWEIFSEDVFRNIVPTLFFKPEIKYPPYSVFSRGRSVQLPSFVSSFSLDERFSIEKLNEKISTSNEQGKLNLFRQCLECIDAELSAVLPYFNSITFKRSQLHASLHPDWKAIKCLADSMKSYINIWDLQVNREHLKELWSLALVALERSYNYYDALGLLREKNISPSELSPNAVDSVIRCLFFLGQYESLHNLLDRLTTPTEVQILNKEIVSVYLGRIQDRVIIENISQRRERCLLTSAVPGDIVLPLSLKTI